MHQRRVRRVPGLCAGDRAPQPVPAARIAFKHSHRGNVHLWLRVENSPMPARKIWPQAWPEQNSCRNLNYTVRLPDEFVWPPSEENRLVLDLYDSGEYTQSGGALETFTAAFGGDEVVVRGDLATGPIAFQAYQLLQVRIP